MKQLIVFILLILITCGSNPHIKYCNILQYNRLTPLSISSIQNVELDSFEIQFKAINDNGDTITGKFFNGIVIRAN